MSSAQLEVVLAHLRLLTKRLFDLSGVDDKIALMMSLQDIEQAFEAVEE